MSLDLTQAKGRLKAEGWCVVPGVLAYGLMLASLLMLAFRMRRLMNRINADERRPEVPPVEQSGDQIDDAH